MADVIDVSFDNEWIYWLTKNKESGKGHVYRGSFIDETADSPEKLTKEPL